MYHFKRGTFENTELNMWLLFYVAMEKVAFFPSFCFLEYPFFPKQSLCDGHCGVPYRGYWMGCP